MPDSTMFPSLPTPSLVVDKTRLEHNLASMQNLCDAAQTELRPHIKTHKCIEIAKRQLELGSAGIVCAKVGEAEAMLPAFEGAKRREVFIANSLVDEALAPRLNRLRENLDDLMLAVTSIHHAPALSALVEKAGGVWPVMMAIDSGLGREGTRNLDQALALARFIESSQNLELRGIYTHEGQFYTGMTDDSLQQWHTKVMGIRTAIENEVGRKLKFWPGSSSSAHAVAPLSGIDAVRPGTYVFGDLWMAQIAAVIKPETVALKVLATVVDKPESGMALLDSGSKTLSGDRLTDGVYASCEYGEVHRVSEEHGFLFGDKTNDLKVGQRILLTLAHVCPAVNLADELHIVDGYNYVESWRVAARGKVN